ncbi:hypothetical protein PVAG01_00019 [Phlyctema vagabunda]|uniref:Uncharacterized protein n=1 Tax=Phlyctema vagabunda TaxID=108571 RepID=A0ABR4PT47_9HELO
MASPEHITIHNLSGNWELNKELSDKLNDVLVIQGVPFLLRKLVNFATVSETVAETKKTDGTCGLIVTKSVAGLFRGTADAFEGSGIEIIVPSTYLSPTVHVRSWWVDLSSKSEPKQPTGELLDPYLLRDWLAEEPAGVPDHFAGRGFNAGSGVTDNMVWGFCLVGGKRYRAVKYYVCKGKQEVRARLVFNWVGKSG